MQLRDVLMTTFICYLRWTDQGTKSAKDSNKRARTNLAEKLAPGP